MSPATTGTICEAPASDRLSVWLRSARPRTSHVGAQRRAGPVAAGQPQPPQRERHRDQQRQHPAQLEHVRVGEADSQQHRGHREPQARRRTGCGRPGPSTAQAQAASSITIAQPAAAMPSTKATRADRVAQRAAQAAGQQRRHRHDQPRRRGREHQHHQQARRTSRRWRWRARAAGSSAISIVPKPEDGEHAEQGLRADRGRRDAELVGVDEPGDQDPEDQPEDRGDRPGRSSRDRNGDQMPRSMLCPRRGDAAVAVGFRHHAPPPTAGGGSTA